MFQSSYVLNNGLTGWIMHVIVTLVKDTVHTKIIDRQCRFGMGCISCHRLFQDYVLYADTTVMTLLTSYN